MTDDAVGATDETKTNQRSKAAGDVGAHVPFQRKEDPLPDDEVPMRVRRRYRDIIERERDRIDPPVDSTGRARRQMSVDTLGERCMMQGIKWAMSLPDWSDPMSLDEVPE